MTGTAMPLSGHAKVATRDVSQAAEQVGRIFCEHRLTPLDRAQTFSAVHNSRRFPGGSINYVAYGGDVEIDPGCLERFFLLQIPLRGGADIACGREITETRPGRAASLLSPTRPAQMRWRASCGQLILMLDRAPLERTIAAYLGREVDEIVFAPLMPLDREPGRSIASQVAHLARLAQDTGADDADLLRRIGEAIGHTLLWQHDSDRRTALVGGPGQDQPAPPRRIAAALEHIDAHIDQPLDLAALARHCGCSPRALQAAFKTHRGETLTEAVQGRRLALLRERLLAGSGDDSVTELVHACGFAHLGRAASAYRAAFGERPSDTLKRRK
ncbi:AraC family transcriptional regulator [Stappia stellulata]|uniref:AraC-like ligand-binding domain-containing protein n=1 Tax=Stappia stellulata TaxID=71235 RepID=UPI001CD679D3|nr:AraC family transcriptional regulator [Stappia stellulata]MCA1244401.1 AraC family transcriptional regulator [Stappia stellulata]